MCLFFVQSLKLHSWQVVDKNDDDDDFYVDNEDNDDGDDDGVNYDTKNI